MRGRPFAPGVSPNPAGRPKGRRNRATEALEEILDGDAEEILRRVVLMAQEGDPTAMRLCIERLLPVRRDRTVRFELPPVETPADLTKATRALLEGVADGEITPGEAAELSKLIDAHVRAVEVTKLTEQVARLEAIAQEGKR